MTVQGDPESPQPVGQSAGLPLVAVAIGAVLAVVAGVLIALQFGGGDDAGSVAVEVAAPDPFYEPLGAADLGLVGPEIFLEPLQSIGTDAFFSDTKELEDVSPVFFGPGTTSRTAMVNTPTGPEGQPAIQPLGGSEPGLYGGTRDNARCNAQKLIEFLERNPVKAAAWATVQGIEPSQIRGFVEGLTPVVLLQDTRVTNHGFRDGRANPIQSVLQKGTAVLVDNSGLPRARCACGNPLLGPVAQPAAVYGDDAWPDFSPDNIEVIARGTPSAQVVIQDLDGGAPFARPVGTDGSQDFPAPAAAIDAIRPELLVPTLGDRSAPPIGGTVVLGTAAATVNLPGFGPFSPVDDLPPDVFINVFTPDDTANAVTQPTVPPAPAAATSAPAPSQPPATVAPTPVAAPTAAPTPIPPPAATSPPSPTPTPAPSPTSAPTATPTSPPRQVVNLTGQGSVSANSTFSGFPASFAVDGDTGSSWFSTGPGVGPAVFTWSGPRTEITEVVFVGNANNSNPEFQTGFGFTSVTLEILDGGTVTYTGTGSGFGWSFAPNAVGDTVRLTFTGHESPDCGGFSELVVRGLQ